MFNLLSEEWFVWQCLPSSCADWPASPIFLLEIEPLKTGKNLLRLKFVKAFAIPTAIVVEIEFRVIHRTTDHIIGAFTDVHGRPQTAVIEGPSFRWLRHHLPEYIRRFTPEIRRWYEKIDATTYLCLSFGETYAEILHGATKNSFGCKRPAMPTTHSILQIHHTFDEFDSYLLRRGLIPIDMDHKWFIYYEPRRLHMRRSWTGFLVYDIRMKDDGCRLTVLSARVNRDRIQYEDTDDDHDRPMLWALLNTLVLGKPMRLPSVDDRVTAGGFGDWPHDDEVGT